MIRNSFIIFLIATSSCFAQFHKTYDWESQPKLHQLSEEEMTESSVGILEKYIVDFMPTQIGGFLKLYETKHTIAKVNDDRGVSRHNTVYIPMYEVKRVVNIKARTISPDGKVTVLDQDNIKDVSNVEEYGDFKIFAIEGAEKNSEIEVLYTVEKQYDIHGSETLQKDYKVKEAQFLFITDELNSRVKAYRTNANFEAVTADKRTAKLLTLTDVQPMIEEEYATPNANKIAVVYQCFPEGQNITNEMFWNNVIENVGSKFFPNSVSNEIKEDLKNIYLEGKESTAFEKLMLLDDYVKTNFTVVQNNNPELTEIDYIIKNRSASQLGILKAYAYYLSALEIPYEVVLTSNRFTYKFDPEFFTPNMLRDFLIYLPNEQKYIAPDRAEYRVSEAPFNILGNQAVFLNKNLEYYFAEIEQMDPDFSRIKRITNINFEDEMEHAEISLNQEYYGHWSATNRAVLAWSSEQGIKDFQDYLTSSGIEDKVIESYAIENPEMLQLEYNKPFVVKSVITSESILEEAGDSYIFQIGKVIGTQSELYQETNRQNPIEMTYPNVYDYTITVNIPKGYDVEGLDALNIDKSYKSKSGEKLAKFQSSYVLIDDKLVITIQEFYKSNTYDINRYEEFRTVINAASDFNKAAILLKVTE